MQYVTHPKPPVYSFATLDNHHDRLCRVRGAPKSPKELETQRRVAAKTEAGSVEVSRSVTRNDDVADQNGNDVAVGGDENEDGDDFHSWFNHSEWPFDIAVAWVRCEDKISSPELTTVSGTAKVENTPRTKRETDRDG